MTDKTESDSLRWVLKNISRCRFVSSGDWFDADTEAQIDEGSVEPMNLTSGEWHRDPYAAADFVGQRLGEEDGEWCRLDEFDIFDRETGALIHSAAPRQEA